MSKNKPKTKTISSYIAAAPMDARPHLRKIRALLKKVAPNATEAIKWGSPVMIEKRILFSFPAYRSHLNFMPTHSALAPFKNDLKKFKTGKDTVQFPYSKPLPKNLIRKIAAYRAKQVREKDEKWMTR